MSFEIIKKIYFKILDKEKYAKYKNTQKNNKKFEYYQNNIREKILNIHAALKEKKSLSFLHSGHLGDLMYSLPLVKELSKNYECNFWINLRKIEYCKNFVCRLKVILSTKNDRIFLDRPIMARGFLTQKISKLHHQRKSEVNRRVQILSKFSCDQCRNSLKRFPGGTLKLP